MRRLWCMLVLASLLASAFVLPASGASPNVRIAFDFASLKATVDALEDPSLTLGRARAVAALPGPRATIAQTSRFDKAATAERYAESLLAAAHGSAAAGDPFAFDAVAAKKAEIAALTAIIARSPETFMAPVLQRDLAYSPQNANVLVHVVPVLGGTSDGWSRGDTFYIALHYFGNDVPALQSLLAHECYHVIQSSVRSRATGPEPSERARAALALFRSLEDEGTASLVGDPAAFPGDGAYSRFLKQKYRRNENRIVEAFELFTSLLYRTYSDESASPNALYDLGFSGTWDSSAYFVGYRMAKVIERYRGRVAIGGLIATASPLDFVRAYAEIAAAHPADPDIVPLPAAMVGIAHALER
ncbi:MAG TPA: DUF5700 domain-containing putative Zn-dependent protease [Candidatus Elarobacter sp.]